MKQKKMQSKTDINPRHLTAIHEAGHAIVAYACGATIGPISVITDDSGECHANWESYKLTDEDTVETIDRAYVLKQIAWTMAGYMAESLISGLPEQYHLDRGGYPDALQANDFQEKFSVSHAVVCDLVAVVKDYLHSYKEDLLMIAELLEKQDTVTSEEINPLLPKNKIHDDFFLALAQRRKRRYA